MLLLDGSTSPPANLAEVCPLCEPAGLAEQNKTVYYPAAPDPTNSIANPINNIGKMHEHVFFLNLVQRHTGLPENVARFFFTELQGIH